MKRTMLLLSLVTTLCIGACKSGGTDKEIATDMCGCFNMLKDSLPPAAIAVFEKTAAAENPQQVFQEEIQKLDPEAQQKVTSVLMGTAKAGSPINDCLKELDKKYKSPTNDQQDAARRMVAALKDKKGCDIMLALMRMNLKK